MGSPEHWDVIIVGAGLSGIGAGARLNELCPGKRWCILEARASLGGTWDFFRYPGLRSDSDMFTFGYPFFPWRSSKTLASGREICSYLRDAAQAQGVLDKIRYEEPVVACDWCSAEQRWTVSTEKQVRTCSFLFLCAGYYQYDKGFTPDFAGMERFKGTIVHPQAWPADLETAGKRVVVIGSGATAITLVPELAKTGAEVTCLQRSPSYIMGLPEDDALLQRLRWAPYGAVFPLLRGLRIGVQFAWFKFCKQFPGPARALIAKVTGRLAPGVDPKHFTPRYNPWDQRICFCPRGDFFAALRRGAAIVTGEVKTFTEGGIELESGEQLHADLVVTATGMNLHPNFPVGDMKVTVDGRPYDAPDTLLYKGAMLGGVPNLAFTMGAHDQLSWTLKSDLVAQFVCRLLNTMEAKGIAECRPTPGADVTPQAWLPLSSSYFARSRDRLPKVGSRSPWQVPENLFSNLWTWKHGRLDDDMQFRGPASRL